MCTAASAIKARLRRQENTPELVLSGEKAHMDEMTRDDHDAGCLSLL
jgi:hypothetical protein